MLEVLLQLGPFGIALIFIIIGTQLENKDDKDGKSKGKTSVSIVLYVIAAAICILYILYSAWLYKNKEK